MRENLFEQICDIALDQCHSAWKIERLYNLLGEVNKYSSIKTKLVNITDALDEVDRECANANDQQGELIYEFVALRLNGIKKMIFDVVHDNKENV